MENLLGIGLVASVVILIGSAAVNKAIIDRLKSKNRYYRSEEYRLKMFEQELALRNKKMKIGE